MNLPICRIVDNIDSGQVSYFDFPEVVFFSQKIGHDPGFFIENEAPLGGATLAAA